ncbi:MAG: hypothetical protein U9R52_03635 [Candidatus Omnitrophota bacterium]|nr:hypothetical protein [Candidatus Omnitrophota bacterium]
MGRVAGIVCVIILGIVFTGRPCHIAEAAADALKFIEETKTHIQQNDREKAISALDAAFQSANSNGNVKALMEIGDLYVKIDPSLKDKAMKAWTSAGRWKCR